MELHPSNWPAEFMCPISRSVMADPVVVSSGQTYERRCIQAWMDLGQSLCVMQRVPLNSNLIIPNTGLKAAIANMAKSKGMRTLPSPPSPESARALARQLILELQHANGQTQELRHLDTETQWSDEERDVRSGPIRVGPFQNEGSDEERDVQSGPIRVGPCQNEEESEEAGEGGIDDTDVPPGPICAAYLQNEEGDKEAGEREGALDDDLLGRVESLRVADESGNLHPPDAHTGPSTDAHERKGIYLISSSSLPRLKTSMEDIDVRRGNFAQDASRLRPTDAYQTSYGAASNIEQGFHRLEAVGGHDRGRSSGSYSHTGPIGDLRRPTTGGALHETPRASRELPPHLLTRPSSYSSPEPSQSSTWPPSMVDPLVQRLRAEAKDEQEAAAAELRQLSRVPENRISMCRTDIIEALLPLFRSENTKVQVNAVASLVNLSIEKPNKVGIVRAGAVAFLVDILNNGCPEAQEHAAGAAFSLAIADENKYPMGVLNVIPPLMQLLQTGSNAARQDAAMALYHLSLLQTNKTKLVKAGAVPVLFNLAQSRERPDLASRALVIVANVASIPEGRAALQQLNAIPVLVRLLAIQGKRNAASIPEQAAAVLVLLAKSNFRFRSIAKRAGALELLTALVENGTSRAREKAIALLAIMKESSSGADEQDADSVISRQYLRMRVDGEQMNSSVF